MTQFFDAVEAYSNLPLVNKNNHLVTFAHLVANNLNNSFFIFIDRDPIYLAQSHLIARRFIHGDEKIPYGARFEKVQSPSPDYVEDICRQITNYKSAMHEQQDLIGEDRYMVVPYESFCKTPGYFVDKVATKYLNHKIKKESLNQLKPISSANVCKIDEDTFNKIKDTITKLLETDEP